MSGQQGKALAAVASQSQSLRRGVTFLPCTIAVIVQPKAAARKVPRKFPNALGHPPLSSGTGRC